MQLSPAALDTAGNLWLAWTTPPRGFPDDSGAGISVSMADPLVRHWSRPTSVVAPEQPGAVLPQLVAAAPGDLALLYLEASSATPKPLWSATLVTVRGLLGPRVLRETAPLGTVPSYQGTATDLMGSGCDPSRSPTSTVSNNPFTCSRSADVLGLSVDRSCRLVATWPSLSAKSNPTLGVSTDATWVTTQTGGSRLCAQAPHITPVRRPAPHRALGPTLPSTGLPYAVVLLALSLTSLGLLRLRPR